MKYLTLLIMMLVLWGCAPQVNTPKPIAPTAAVQHFGDFCREGYLESRTIKYRDLPNVPADSCQTYTLANLVPPLKVTSRISGTGVEINHECVMIESIETTQDTFERIRCVFTDGLSVINIYLLGEDIRVISEVVNESGTYYLPPLGVESESIP